MGGHGGSVGKPRPDAVRGTCLLIGRCGLSRRAQLLRNREQTIDLGGSFAQTRTRLLGVRFKQIEFACRRNRRFSDRRQRFLLPRYLEFQFGFAFGETSIELLKFVFEIFPSLSFVGRKRMAALLGERRDLDREPLEPFLLVPFDFFAQLFRQAGSLVGNLALELTPKAIRFGSVALSSLRHKAGER
ncbi:MAG: hypothetical protein EOQ62_03790 [Mesorhizobium sp.]|uniref:hypothetical protein n=1 Tax=Mesorhizobium sp. TaxID=1871066 RepID=UPI000FE8CB35|nr:hypothetical protein [Mesorhizobium sp.]RWG50425.1 MAG: hypothetical protein EOQ62_03790 [Mesorhizobium sp.]RWL05182.1 MAG: hypothetical protein EOR55_12960 [Mesorhizobium sp.]TIN10204.1 MAG: hypothetical protein E5Y14_11710 [Mesorhizobium sp.]TIQ61803.1 MAG: hypothetical protein E5X41_31515 [Mesorhizobium sp.]